MTITKEVDRSEYQEIGDDDHCPGCDGITDDVAFDDDGNALFVEINPSSAPPDMQGGFYECHGSTWLITCQNCGTKFAAYYSNY